MIKEILQSIHGVDKYAVISLVIFVTVFVGVTIRILFYDKKEIQRWKELPLDKSCEKSIDGDQSHV